MANVPPNLPLMQDDDHPQQPIPLDHFAQAMTAIGLTANQILQLQNNRIDSPQMFSRMNEMAFERLYALPAFRQLQIGRRLYFEGLRDFLRYRIQNQQPADLVDFNLAQLEAFLDARALRPDAGAGQPQ